MKIIPVSLAILTWKAPLTLEITLEALEPINFLFSEKIVVCQESNPDELFLARKYGFKAIPLSKNRGIQNGLKIAAQSCRYQQFLLLENDCFLNCSPEIAAFVIKAFYKLLLDEKIDFASLQEIAPDAGKRFKKYWTIKQKEMKRTIFGKMRRKKANDFASKVISYPEPEALKQPYIEKIGNFLFLTNSEYCRWSNRAVFTDKDFFLAKLIKRAEACPTSRTRNGFPGLEHPINSFWRRSWWRKQRFRIGLAKPGLFSHVRCERPRESN